MSRTVLFLDNGEELAERWYGGYDDASVLFDASA